MSLGKGMRVYRGRYGTALNILWWVAGPLTSLALVIGVLSRSSLACFIALGLILTESILYAGLIIHSEEIEKEAKVEKRKEELKKALEGSKWDPTQKDNWRFKLGKNKWGFILLVIGFALFLITWFIIRPLLVK